MVRSELRTLVNGWLDDPDAGYFTATTVNAWLNNAQREAQKQLVQVGENYYLKRTETPTIASQADYVLPSSFYKLHRIEVIISGTGTSEDRQRLAPITLNSQNYTTNSLGTPECYVLLKDRVTLFPTPDSVKTLRLYYSYSIADMTSDTDSPDVPVEYHEYIAIMAAFNGFIKDDRVPSQLKEKADEYKVLMKQSATDRKQDGSRRVRNTAEY